MKIFMPQAYLNQLSYRHQEMENLVTLETATKSFGKNKVLQDIDLTISEGELVAVLGENGAGKTTLLRIMAGLLGLDRGTLKIAGEELDRFSEKQREQYFFLPDFPVLFDEISVLDNVAIWLSLYGRADHGHEDAVMQQLEKFHIAKKANQSPATLSRGQRYKVALTCYESVEARLGLFDEPFASGMDAPGLGEMQSLIRNAVGKKRTVIYTTQLVRYAVNFADRILVVDQAQIYFDGTPESFSKKMATGDPILAKFSEESL